MGCAASARTDKEPPNGTVGVRGSSEDGVSSTMALDLIRPPAIPIHVGSGVTRHAPDTSGGPGSRKGNLIQEMVQLFDFTAVNCEEIVFGYLPNKVANTVESISEMQDLLKKDSGVISVEWILNMISAKLSTSMGERFVIDIVPALTSLLKCEAFNQPSHDKHLENFERRHPVLFALELLVPDEKALLESAKKANEQEEKEKKKELSPELSAFLKGMDEADKGRLERRLDAHHHCADIFLSYFRKTKRVVQMELVGSIDNDHLMRTLHTLLADFGFTPSHDAIRAVLFAFSDHLLPSTELLADERHVADIDLTYYRMKKVFLHDVVHDRSESLTSMIRAVRRYINRTASEYRHFLVILDCLNETNDDVRVRMHEINCLQMSKRINFMERKNCYLDHYIRARADREPSSRFRTPFHAFTSTTAEVCLFPSGFPTALCKKIAFIFGEKLNSDESEAVSRASE